MSAASETRGARSRWRELAADRRLFYAVPALALLVPAFTNPYTQFVVNLMLVYILVTVGFNIVMGYLGQLAFANTAFFGLGAYSTGLLMVYAKLPFLAALVLGGVAGALAGFLASVTALRGIRLYYLAIITLAFGELMRWIYIHADGITRGTDGLPVPAADLFGFALDTELRKYYVFLAIVVVVVKGTSNLLRSRIGRAIVAVRDNEFATASLGIPTARYIVLAFMWSGFVVGIGGGLFAVLIGRVVPESFGLVELILHFAMVMVGGLGSLAGSVIGAIALTALPEYFRRFPGLEEMFFGAILVLVLLFMPKGLGGFLARRLRVFREPLYRE